MSESYSRRSFPLRLAVAIALAAAVGLTLIGVSIAERPSGVIGTLRFEAGAVAAAEAEPPAVSRSAAERNAREMLADMEPELRGLTVTAAGHIPGLKRLVAQSGDSQFESTTALNAWVLEFVGEPTAAYNNVSAVVVVDAVTGKIKAASVSQTN